MRHTLEGKSALLERNSGVNGCEIFPLENDNSYVLGRIVLFNSTIVIVSEYEEIHLEFI